ncbi:MAG: plastocyanin/azurin family copper-binding protein [Gemmatimonadaceae bacterium]
MQFVKRSLVASAFVLGACAGGDKAADSDTAMAPGMGGDTSAMAPAPGTSSGAAMAITGTTHEVKMVGDDKGYRFEPANITVKQGDGIKFLMVSGGPHNVAFDPAKIPDDVESQLTANMPSQMSPLMSPMFMNPNESYTISFAGIKAGSYPYNCTPHIAMNMTGTITVQ